MLRRGIVALLVVGLLGPTSALAAGKPTPAEDQPMTLGFTPKELQARFNRQASQRDMEFRISGVQLKPSTPIADQWVYQFNDRIGFMAMVNRKDGTIRSITYMGSGDGSVESGSKLMFGVLLLVRSVDPALSDKTANRLALDLVEALKVKDGIERVQNGVRYGSVVLPKIGLMLAINPVQ